MFGHLRLLGSGTYVGLLIPDEAITTQQSDQIVYVVGPGGRVAQRKIATGPLVDGLRVVRSGLTAGDEVVVTGLERVKAGVVASARPGKITPPNPGASPTPGDLAPPSRRRHLRRPAAVGGDGADSRPHRNPSPSHRSGLRRIGGPLPLPLGEVSWEARGGGGGGGGRRVYGGAELWAAGAADAQERDFRRPGAGVSFVR
jgi:hypothetical protein